MVIASWWSCVHLVKLDGLTYPQELERIDITLPRVLDFMRSLPR
jgi:hypothetical protein